MEKQYSILMVDDSPIELMVLREPLESSYNLHEASDGESGLKALDDNKIDLVLLDVNMPGMSGYDVCSEIRKRTNSVPVIFVSANSSTEEILKGFEVGGNDYVTKPINPKVLKQKVHLALEQYEKQAQLEKRSKEASSTAMSALTSAGDMGIILNYVREGIKCKSLEELAALTVQTLKDFNLSACVQFRDAEAVHNQSNGDVMSTLETELLSRTVNMSQRMLEKGNRLIISFPTVSCLVKNLPLNEHEKLGQIKDYIVTICDDADLLNKKLAGEVALASRRSEMISKALNAASNMLQEFEEDQRIYNEKGVQIMDTMLIRVEEILFQLGLTEDQEQALTSILQESTAEALKHADEGANKGELLAKLVDQLTMIAKSFE